MTVALDRIELSGEAQELLGAVVGYLGVLLELAGEPAEIRRKRYVARVPDAEAAARGRA